MKHTIIAAVALTIVFTIGCTNDFEEINTNPNFPTVDEANPALLLPKILYELGNESTARLSWGLGNIVAQLVATNNFTGNDIYNWGTNSGSWNLYYRNMRDANNLEVLGQNLANPVYEGAALVLRSWTIAQLTEMYGDVPFTEALAGKEGEFTPAYTEQAEIYRNILSDLEKAANLLSTATVNVDGDILYGGFGLSQGPQWAKFANSLRLRYTMRLESKWAELGIDGPSTLQSLANASLMESNDDNAAVPYLPVGANRWPLHTARVGSFDEKRMSEKAEGILKAFNDPRLEIYYRPVDNPDRPGEFIGVANGLSEDNASNYNGGANNQSRLGTRFREDPATVEMMFMHYSEVQFILAEAAEKGYISGDAQAFYEAGVTSSMEYYGAVIPDDYLTQDGVAYGTGSSNLELIGTQKWLASLMVGLEAWFDYRRTGIPELLPGPNALFDEVPVRIQYPGDEQVLNGENYDQVISRQGPDEILTRMWLLK